MCYNDQQTHTDGQTYTHNDTKKTNTKACTNSNRYTKIKDREIQSNTLKQIDKHTIKQKKFEQKNRRKLTNTQIQPNNYTHNTRHK